ncbi:cobalamin B12-binding domain-containing protein [Aerococcus sanguinicola]|uniref:cobalamin B12-binding domain-containing protein n=1 Tax=unclassified Aerococcus TaxID=2618060 RepID=UPI0008A6281C|nr:MULTISPECIES: cobalamin-dependent protein [unclassified Aerococcus]MDK6234402.1 cobalamin-dependent protein [Aerococcus sp. UMB10185]MDK6805904.1 cobalamin-dependent protein [Aerococcus sp. UMB7834]MDK6856181.1 cobalamin-dependent protein [Aerococcus sp. UMB7533]MDK8503260.1 cobalamin-dependent protein [Aerococcus sp. UMB1112A]OFN01012.1 cobalamin-binding protein [Aerococcus sp. HMSC062A02]
MRSKEELIQELSDMVFEMEDEEIIDTAEEYVQAGYDVQDAIMEGLVDGMSRAGVLFAEEEYYVTDVLICSDALNEAMAIFKPLLLERKEEGGQARHKIVLGTVEGDTHDIGKNLVKVMLEVGGFEVIDMGRDVPLDDFIDRAIEEDAELIGLSALMTTTMTGMKTLIERLEERGIRDQFKVMIGGGAVSQYYCDEIGADGYSEDAIEAVELAKRLVGESED